MVSFVIYHSVELAFTVVLGLRDGGARPGGVVSSHVFKYTTLIIAYKYNH